MNLNRFLYINFPKQYGKIQGLLGYFFLPFKLILFKLNMNIFFGDKDQDRWVVEEIFDYKKNGFFLDLAASDGLHGNNTFFLEKRLKWRGICIEPNKKYFKKLVTRRTTQCICEVIDKEKEGTVDFLPNGAEGGIIGDEYDNNEFKRHSLLLKARKKNKIEKRKSKTLLSILNDCGAPKTIDFFSLDVEGAETNILKNFPFEKYKFLSLTIERPTEEINKILFSNDYLFVRNYKVDGFYIHKSLKDKINIRYEKFIQINKKSW